MQTQKLFDYVNAFKGELSHWSFEEKETELLRKYILFSQQLTFSFFFK